jgi:hypothetical protein
MRLVDRQRAQQKAVDDREDRGVRADAKRQRQHDRREAAMRREHPEREPNVLAELVQPCAVAARTDPFLHLLDSAELDQRLAPRFGGRKAVPSLVGRGHLDEGPKLLVQPLLGAVATEHPVEHRRDPMEDCHAP